jgi:hypothetical protein
MNEIARPFLRNLIALKITMFLIILSVFAIVGSNSSKPAADRGQDPAPISQADLTFEPAFYVMVWDYQIEHPDGERTDRKMFFKNKFEKNDCDAKQAELEEKVALDKITTTDGGKAIFSQFICVPVSK